MGVGELKGEVGLAADKIRETAQMSSLAADTMDELSQMLAEQQERTREIAALLGQLIPIAETVVGMSTGVEEKSAQILAVTGEVIREVREQTNRLERVFEGSEQPQATEAGTELYHASLQANYCNAIIDPRTLSIDNVDKNASFTREIQALLHKCNHSADRNNGWMANITEQTVMLAEQRQNFETAATQANGAAGLLDEYGQNL